MKRCPLYELGEIWVVFPVMGTPNQCIRKIESCINAGATHLVLSFPDFPFTDSLELFSKRVLPSFK